VGPRFSSFLVPDWGSVITLKIKETDHEELQRKKKISMTVSATKTKLLR
jgi:hypothetical protein